MAHMVDRCDFIDVFDEATKTGGAVDVELSGGQRFTDHVRSVDTEGGKDFVTFRQHGRVSLDDVRDCRRSQPLEASYDAKL